MAAPAAIKVPCPECGEEVEVDIDVLAEPSSDDALVLRLQPNVSKMAEHYTVEHCGAEVSEP